MKIQELSYTSYNRNVIVERLQRNILGQCFDLANMYWNKLFGHGLRGQGAADIPNVNNFKGEAKVYNNTPSFKAQAGDIVIVLHIIIDSLFYNLSLVLVVNRGIPQTIYESMSGMGCKFSHCSRGIPFKI